MKRMTTTAIAALIAAPLVLTGPALAQTADTGTQSAPKMETEIQAEQVVASVGDTEITSTEVDAAIKSLPPQIQAQPSEEIVPFAIEQLILRELILQDADAKGIVANAPDMAGNIATDDTVAEDTDMAADDSAGSSDRMQQNARDSAIIQAYLGQEMEGVVTDEAVQAVYDDAKATTTSEVPPLDAVRPQIEQQLKSQALNELRTELKAAAKIVYYGADGQPIDAPVSDNG